MGLIRGTKNTIKSMVNIPRFMSYGFLKSTSAGLANSAKSLFIPAQPKYHETYEQALQRLNLSEQDIAERKQEFSRLVTIFGLVSIVVFAYALYLLANAKFLSGAMALTVTALVLAKVFK